jgi:hypothetical protein
VELRREAQKILIVHGNIGKDTPIKECQDTGDAFCRVGAALVSRHVAEYPWLRILYEKWLGWDIHSAGEFILGLGNEIKYADSYVSSVSPTVVLIRDALRLPPIRRSSVRAALEENAAMPGPLNENADHQIRAAAPSLSTSGNASKMAVKPVLSIMPDV